MTSSSEAPPGNGRGALRDPTAAAAAVRMRTARQPLAAIVLGSGLGVVAEQVTGSVCIPYAELPGMPTSGVSGHAGELIVGTLAGVPVVVFSGRVHLYEGWRASDVAFGIDVAAELGATTLIATNAAGAVNPHFAIGDVMIISDHINLLGDDPMRDCFAGPGGGAAAGDLPGADSSPFVPMAGAYSYRLRGFVDEAARAAAIPHVTGVYAANRGPSYETAAEVRMLRVLGADAVGMSTVPEVIRARWHGMEVLGLSIITNMGTGMRDVDHDHQQVTAAACAAAGDVSRLISDVCARLAK